MKHKSRENDSTTRERLALIKTGFFEKIPTMWRKMGLQPNHAGSPIKVQLYGKKDCHLCDLAKSILFRVQKEFPFELEEIDIESSGDLYAEFREKIPVVFIHGRQTFMYKISEKRLRQILATASASADR